ncbi:uncharacterized protein LOC135393350 isoform X2 [Ornithodoros turicata]
MRDSAIVLCFLFVLFCAATLINLSISNLLFRSEQCPSETTQAPVTCIAVSTTKPSTGTTTTPVVTATNITTPASATPTAIPTYHFACGGPDCIRKIYESATDPKVSPCDDFFAYTCSGFFRSFPNTSSVTLLQKDDIARYIIEQVKSALIPPSGQGPFEKAAGLFEQCEEREANKDKSIHYISDFLQRLGMPSPSAHFEPIDVVVKSSLLYNINVLFQLRPSPKENPTSFTDRSWGSLEMIASPEMIDCIAYLYSGSGSHSQPVRGFDEAYVPSIMMQGADEKDFESKFEMNFIKIPFLTSLISDPYTATPENLWFGSLAVDIPSQSWVEAFRKYSGSADFMNTSLTIPKASAELFHHFSKLKDTSTRDFVYKYTKVILEFVANVSNYQMAGTRWSCYNLTMSAMPYAFAWPILNGNSINYYTFSLLRAVLNKVNATMNSVKYFPTFRGMSWSWPSLARDFNSVIGVPREWSYEANLSRYYASYPDINAHDVFISSFVSVSTIAMRALVLEKPSQWPPPDLAATLAVTYSTRRRGSLKIPPSVLFPPFYKFANLDEMNYGSLGSSMASAWMLQGADFGQSPLFRQTASNDLRYSSRLCCPNPATWRPYSISEEARDVKVLGGDVAWPYFNELYEKLYATDLLGIQTAHRAYKDSYWQGQEHDFVSNTRLFFSATCYRWCNSQGATEFEWEGDVSPRLRCNEPLKDIPEFAAAFSCPRGSPMSPLERCVGLS